ncbi:MAG: hypothetical protein ACJA2S_000467 [Cyclobacteriaceae bacterium]|jgi:hypothetical protein
MRLDWCGYKASKTEALVYYIDVLQQSRCSDINAHFENIYYQKMIKTELSID